MLGERAHDAVGIGTAVGPDADDSVHLDDGDFGAARQAPLLHQRRQEPDRAQEEHDDTHDQPCRDERDPPS